MIRTKSSTRCPSGQSYQLSSRIHLCLPLIIIVQLFLHTTTVLTVRFLVHEYDGAYQRTDVTFSSFVFSMLFFNRSTPSLPLAHRATPSCPSYLCPTTREHASATASVPISERLWWFMHWTKGHQTEEGNRCAVQSCWMFPEHSSVPCLHVTP